MREQIADAIKQAMKAKDKLSLSTLRMVQAAIHDRDIANRGAGKAEASEDEVVALMSKLVKQREESAKLYDVGGRAELATKEREEIEIIRRFLPRQMDEAETRAAISAAIAETGATGPKDMGKVMGALKARHAGQMDFSRANATIKELLAQAQG